MSNANRDYAIVYDVKNSLLVLSRPLVFYITDKNTSNIFVKLVTRVIVGDGIDQYTDIENASSYVLTMRVIKPDDEVKSIIATQHESESIFQFDLTEDFKDIPGKYICELTISNIVNGRQEFTTSDPFNYEVKRSILSNVKNIIEGKDTTVEKLLNDLFATKAELSSQIKEKANITDVRLRSLKITSNDLDTSADANKIKLNNLSDEVQQAMAGNSPVNPVIPNESITTEKYAKGSIDHQVMFSQLLRGMLTHNSENDIDFDFRDDKLVITFEKNPRIFTSLKGEYILSKNVYEVPYPSYSEFIFLVYNIESDNMYMWNYTEYYQNYNNNNIIILGKVNRSSKTIEGFSNAFDGLNYKKRINETFNNFVHDGYVKGNHIFSQNRNFLLVSNGVDKHEIIFDDNNRTITLKLGTYPRFISNLLDEYRFNKSEITLSYPTIISEFNFLLYNIELGEFILANYDEYSELKDNNNIIIVANIDINAKRVDSFNKFVIKQPESESESGFLIDECRLLLPPKFYISSELETRIFKSSIIPNETSSNHFLLYCTDGKCSDTIYNSHNIITNENNMTFLIRQYESDTLYSQDVSVEHVSPTNVINKSPKILHLGDSITNRGIAMNNKNNLISLGINPVMVGTTLNHGDVRGEGRESWTFANFIGKSNIYHNENAAIVPSLNGETTNLKQNPFLRIATDDDKALYPKYCFRNTGAMTELSYEEDSDKTGDFYIFDFETYLLNHNVDTPDIVTIALSTNDLYFNPDGFIDDCKLGLDIMIAQIKKANPNVKIGIVPTPAWGITNKKFATLGANWIDECINYVENRNDDNIQIIPVWCHLDRVTSFPMNKGDYVGNSKLRVATVSDPTHLNSQGSKTYSNVITNYCLYVLS